MGVSLHIPDSIAQAIRFPEPRLERELMLELAVALYIQDALSFGKARELAGMSHIDFAQLLGARGAVRHYGPSELDDDIAYASRQ
jgi:predicted HTH domain antitoxin